MKVFNKIKDERLQLLHLKNIRIVFIFQNLIIAALWVYYDINGGSINVTKLLFLIWPLSVVLLMYLQLGISVDLESDKEKKKQRPYYKKVLFSLVIGIIFGLIMVLCGTPIRDSIIIGFVFFVVYLISGSITYYLKKKRLQDLDD